MSKFPAKERALGMYRKMYEIRKYEESIYYLFLEGIMPGTIHQFWGEGPDGILIDGERYGVSGEVSSVCDDISDNVFIHGGNRVPGIDEDEEKICYLCNEYPAASAD